MADTSPPAGPSDRAGQAADDHSRQLLEAFVIVANPPPFKATPPPENANPYLTLRHVLKQTFWLAASARHGEDVRDHLNPTFEPWPDAEAIARGSSSAWGIPFATFDPVLTDAKRTMWELSQIAAGNTSLPFEMFDSRYTLLEERLEELANSSPAFAGDPPRTNPNPSNTGDFIEGLLAGHADVELNSREMALLEAHLMQEIRLSTIQREKHATGRSVTQENRSKLTLIRDFNRGLRQIENVTVRPSDQKEFEPMTRTPAESPSEADELSRFLELSELAESPEKHAVSSQTMQEFQSLFGKFGSYIVDLVFIGPADPTRTPNAVPIIKTDCLSISGTKPLVCPRSSPKLPVELVPRVEERFRSLRLVSPDQTVLWVGRQSHLDTLCMYRDGCSCFAENAPPPPTGTKKSEGGKPPTGNANEAGGSEVGEPVTADVDRANTPEADAGLWPAYMSAADLATRLGLPPEATRKKLERRAGRSDCYIENESPRRGEAKRLYRVEDVLPFLSRPE